MRQLVASGETQREPSAPSAGPDVVGDLLATIAMAASILGGLFTGGLVVWAMFVGLFDFDDATSQAWLAMFLLCVGIFALSKILLDRPDQTEGQLEHAGGNK